MSLCLSHSFGGGGLSFIIIYKNAVPGTEIRDGSRIFIFKKCTFNYQF